MPKKNKPSGKPTYVADTYLAEKFSVSRTTIWRWTSNGEFPAAIKLSEGCTRWRLADVEKWEAERTSVKE